MLKKFTLMCAICLFLLTLVSCGGISQSYADKINKKAEAEEHLVYSQVVKKLGKNIVSNATLGAGDDDKTRSGAVIAVKGCKTWDEVEDKIDNGKDVKGIIVTFVLGKAVSAEYRLLTERDA